MTLGKIFEWIASIKLEGWANFHFKGNKIIIFHKSSKQDENRKNEKKTIKKL